MYSPRQKILWFALSTRTFIIILQIISNAIIPDHKANVFLSPEDPTLGQSVADKIVNILLSGFKRWDGQYFIHIAQYGYTYENCLAFFPLYPLIVRYLAYAMNEVLGGFLNIHSLIMISSILVNLFCFVKSVDVLHMLSLKILRSERRAYKSAILYCVNPAGIFFTAPYSESMFAWMTFYAIYKCTEVESLRFTNIDFLSSLPVGLSMVTRSNGTINLGFIVYTSFKNVVEKTLPEITSRFRTLKHYALTPFLLLPLFTSVMALALTLIVSLLPFLVVQTYNYFKFCMPHEHNLPKFLIQSDRVLPGKGASPWCNVTLPLSYSYIQSQYWDVGFLKYYKWEQLPNFLLAFPIIYIMLYNGYVFTRLNFKHCLRLGLRPNIFSANMTKMGLGHRQSSINSILYEPNMFVYFVHSTLLTLFCVIFVHIQVTTRLLASASPILYWICSGFMNVSPTPTADQNTINEHFRRIGASKRIPSHHLSIANLEGVDNMYSKWRTFIISKSMPDYKSRLLQYYFLGYLVVGTVCYSNFYPWT